MRALYIPIASALLLAACSGSQSNSSDSGSTYTDPGSTSTGSANTARANPRNAETPTALPVDLVLSSFKVHDGLGNTGPLDLDSLRQFVIDATYTASPGTHSQLVDVFDPHGTLYTSLKSQVVADADGNAFASQLLQVAGTSIEQFRMAGAWQLVLIVDGKGLASVTVEVVD